MKNLIKLEEAAMTAVGIFFLTKYNLGLSLMIWVPLFFSPDISMFGYLVNPRFGADCYNLFHHRAIALAVIVIGYYTGSDVATAIGLLLFTHSSFDRTLGYGLKYLDNFKHTHLGWLKNPKKENPKTSFGQLIDPEVLDGLP